MTIYVLDEIKIMKESHMDPLNESLHVFDQMSTGSGTEKYMKGLVVLVHGSPCEGKLMKEMYFY